MTQPGRDRASLRYPVEPIVATSVPELPVGPGWAYEPKWDGWRQVAWIRENRVQLQTRNGHPIGLQFPDITRALRPLATTEESLLPAPLAERRQMLEELLTDVSNQIVLCPHSTSPEVAGEWIDTWVASGIEGVVAKRRDQRYLVGRGGWRKLRVRTTAEAIIGGVTGWTNAPQTVLVGRYDSRGRLRYSGRSTPLTDEQRAELAPLLSRPAAQRRGMPVHHPWPQPLPASWSGSWQRPEPLRYAQVEPNVVAELLVDTAFEHGRYRHPVQHIRARRDISAYDVPLLGVDE